MCVSVFTVAGKEVRSGLSVILFPWELDPSGDAEAGEICPRFGLAWPFYSSSGQDGIFVPKFMCWNPSCQKQWCQGRALGGRHAPKQSRVNGAGALIRGTLAALSCPSAVGMRVPGTQSPTGLPHQSRASLATGLWHPMLAAPRGGETPVTIAGTRPSRRGPPGDGSLLA